MTVYECRRCGYQLLQAHEVALKLAPAGLGMMEQPCCADDKACWRRQHHKVAGARRFEAIAKLVPPIFDLVSAGDGR